MTLGNLDLKFAQWIGTAWSIQSVDQTGDVGSRSSIAVDHAGKPHISYFDGTNFHLKYALGDWTPPMTTQNYDNKWHNSTFTITLTAQDDSNRIKQINYKINNGPSMTVAANGQPSISTESSNNTLEYWSIDAAGNQETHKTLIGIKLDITPPSGSIKINNNDASTNTTSVTLTLTASDATSGLAQLRFSNDSLTLASAAWQPYATSPSWTLQGPNGNKTVFVQFKDNAGLISQIYNATITLSLPPVPVLDHFDFSSIGNQITDTNFQITITAKDSSGKHLHKLHWNKHSISSFRNNQPSEHGGIHCRCLDWSDSTLSSRHKHINLYYWRRQIWDKQHIHSQYSSTS